MMKFIITIFVATLVFCFSSIAEEVESSKENIKKTKVTIADMDQSDFVNKAVLQGLNKITAKTQKLEILVNNEIHFGKLSILLHKCWKAPLHEAPENKMLIEVFDMSGNKGEKKRIFFGWIFSSSPSISGIEHPIYDLTAIKCIN